MRLRSWTWIGVFVLAALAAGLVVLLSRGGGTSSDQTGGNLAPFPGQPTVKIISPRDGSRHTSGAVVVKVDVRNFELAPAQFHRPPQFRQGFIRFSLRSVPQNASAGGKTTKASNGAERVIGRSFDYPRYSGPNGLLAERTGVAGLYSPATQPEIYYHNLPPGYYRLIMLLAQNNGSPTPYHSVSHFSIQRSS